MGVHAMRKTLKALSLLVVFAALLACETGPGPSPAAADIPRPVVEAVGATDYGAVRIKKFPVAVQCWTYRKFSFEETLEKVKSLGIGFLQAYPGQRFWADGRTNETFVHGMAEETMTAARDMVRAAGLSLAAYGVVDIGTTEDNMRKVFDFARKMRIRTIVCEPRADDFDLLEKLVKEYNVQIAIHNHPAPAKYAHPVTALELVRGRDERIGVSADTGHWMREGLKPVECLRLLEGRIVDVHLKDRSAFGKGPEAVDVAWGRGDAGVRDILAELTLQDYPGLLTVEYENEEEVETPEPAILRGLEFVKDVTYYEDAEQILRRRGGRYEKHGWNHYGPGHFELDGKTGILKSQGGMGLLWYAVKTFKDFVLELDFKCSEPETNSGVFLRVPGVPASDDYIYHSFEIQIQDSGEGIHKTGAAYDAEAPRLDAARPTGEWNHFKITCRGRRITVELNGREVLDWEAEPRGKVRDFALEGYIGLQNHDSVSPVYFKDIFIREL
jgi:sugar phosphate isomerase/epimerase